MAQIVPKALQPIRKPASPSTRSLKIQPKAAPATKSEVGDLQQAEQAPQGLAPATLNLLQTTIGNRAVGRLIPKSNPPRPTLSRGLPVQPKLQVGAAHDAYEQEADQVAAQVMRAPASASPQAKATQAEAVQTKPLSTTITPLTQPAPTTNLQTKGPLSAAGFEAGSDFEQNLATTHNRGLPLPAPTRAFMEPHFGTNFENVRLHTGRDSKQLNRAIGAQAFTKGKDIYLGAGKENVESHSGKQLLAHELTHVVQQQSSTAVQRVAAIDLLGNAANRAPVGAGIKPQEQDVIQQGRMTVKPSTDLNPAQAPYLWVIKEIKGRDEMLIGHDQIVNTLRIGHPTVSATKNDDDSIDHTAKVGGEIKYETFGAFNRNVRGKQNHWVVNNESGRFGSIDPQVFGTHHGSKVLKGAAQLLFKRSGGKYRAKVKKFSSANWKRQLQTQMGSYKEHNVKYGQVTPDAQDSDSEDEMQ